MRLKTNFSFYKIILGSLLALFFCFCLAYQTKGQSLAPNYTLIGKEDGIPEAKLSGLSEDADGFVWFANGSSLCRWDGHHFQSFWIKDKKGVKYHDYIATFSWDSLHILVLESNRYFLFNTRTFESWDILDKPVPTYKPIKNNHRFPLYSNGLLWYVNYEGVKLYDLEKRQYHFFSLTNSTTNSALQPNLVIFPDGSAYCESISNKAGQKSDWLYLSPKHDTLLPTTLPKPFNQCFANILLNINDSLALTLSYDLKNGKRVLRHSGFWHLDTRQWEPMVLPNNEHLKGDWIYVIQIDDHTCQFADVWSTLPGYRMDTRTMKISAAHPIFNTLSKGSRGILQHSSGVFLQDAEYSTIAKFHGSRGLFQSTPSVDALVNTFGNPAVYSHLKLKDRILIYGDYPGFIQQTKDKVYLDSFFHKPFFYSLLLEKPDIAIAGSADNGAFWFNPNEEKIKLKRLPNYSNRPPVLDSVSIMALLKDSRGYIWMSLSRSNGIVRLDTRQKVYKHFPSSKGFLPFRYPSNIVEDKTGDLWMTCQWGGGLVRWRHEKDSFEVVESMTGRMENGYKFPTDIHGGLVFDADGNLYLGTQTVGVLKYNPQTHHFQNWNQEQGLSHNGVLDMCFDAEGFLWVATSDGLNRFDPKTGHFKHFFKEHGLPSNEIHGVKWWDTDGTSRNNREGYVLFIGCKGGYRLLDIRDLEKVKPNLNLLLTRFNVNGKPTAANFDKTIQLGYNENNLDIEWTLVNFIDGHLNRFSYRFLSGKDTTWQDLGHTNLARLVGLGSGDYRLQLRVILNGGETVLSPELRIHIRMPFWKSVWFYIFLGGLAVGLVIFYYRERIGYLKKETAMRKNISADLHDDIGATLSNVNILTTLVRQRLPNDVDVLPLLKRIEEEITSSSESLDDIIWSVNPQNDSMERVLSRMRQFANEVFEAKGIEGHLDFDKKLINLSLSLEKRHNFYLIYKEAVNNLAKYANCTTANIYLTETDGKWILIVPDDGCGFDPLSTREGNGQKTMRQRAKNLNGTLEIQSALGMGTRIELRFSII